MANLPNISWNKLGFGAVIFFNPIYHHVMELYCAIVSEMKRRFSLNVTP